LNIFYFFTINGERNLKFLHVLVLTLFENFKHVDKNAPRRTSKTISVMFVCKRFNKSRFLHLIGEVIYNIDYIGACMEGWRVYCVWKYALTLWSRAGVWATYRYHRSSPRV